MIVLCLTACVPARIPPQLEHTPGPGVVVSGQVYDSGRFRAEAPAGWRVITSAAGDPVTVIFAAPDAPALIMLGEGLESAPPPAGYDGSLRSEQREIGVGGGVRVTAILNAAQEEWDTWTRAFEQVTESLRLSF